MTIFWLIYKRRAVADSPVCYFNSLTNEMIVSSYFCGALTLTRECEGPIHIDGTPVAMPAELNVKIVEEGLKVLVKKRF